MKNKNLWNKLNAFELDDPEAKFTFSQRLAKENGWSHAYAIRVIREYKKFLYLSVVYKQMLTPSEDVDQAWHLHMIYTDSYWIDLCKNTLGTKFHHNPTKGGKKEASKFDVLYQNTLDIYKEEFGYAAPSDIWLDVKKRFEPVTFQRINMSENIVLNKTKVKQYMYGFAASIAVFLITFALISADTQSESKYTIGDFFLWLVIGIVAVFLIRGIYRYITRKSRSNKNSDGSDAGCSSTGCTIYTAFIGCGSSGCSSHSGCSSGSGCSSSGCSSGCGSGCGGGCGGGGCSS